LAVVMGADVAGAGRFRAVDSASLRKLSFRPTAIRSMIPMIGLAPFRSIWVKRMPWLTTAKVRVPMKIPKTEPKPPVRCAPPRSLDGFRGDLSSCLDLLIGFGCAEADPGGRLSAMGGVRPLVVVEGDPSPDAGSCLHIDRPGARALFETSGISVPGFVDRFSGQAGNILAKVVLISGIIRGLDNNGCPADPRHSAKPRCPGRRRPLGPPDRPPERPKWLWTAPSG
jgi:hypothetical protein